MKSRARKGKRSGLLPHSYQALSEDEKTQVKAAFRVYNKNHPHNPYFEIEVFYHRVYRKGGWFA
ncbi:hypothetical protein [Methanosarcina flavescens]|jgi:hypothetical protein|uniref:Uncharacterized protein n=1 Tax=Methanosarcina flavescens TaxID=1715806 RepID=A0A660HQW1_9EURY|nr:hypothetical protein [Methanosarcina flavescens]AYK14499.1 hypothetical protein AOB57_004210 [Methanosarcina flavescens]